MKYNSSDLINALIVDDHPVYRKGLIGLLQAFPFRIVIDEASNGREAIEVMNNKNYELVFLDIQMKIMDGIEAAGIIKKKYPATKIIAITFISNKIKMIEMLEIGVDGYILKDIGIKEMIKAIEMVLEGNMYLSPEVHNEWSEYLMNKARISSKPHSEELSEREIEILKLICFQMSSVQIAEKLFLAESTVNNHRVHIMNKTKSENIIALLIYAIKHGYFNPEVD